MKHHHTYLPQRKSRSFNRDLFWAALLGVVAVFHPAAARRLFPPRRPLPTRTPFPTGGATLMTRSLFAGFAVLLFLVSPVAALAQDAEHILILEDTPEQRVYQLTTRLRHTTVITLPPHETILDFVVGDGEYWHLTGSANVAFLKPISDAAATNIALVCASGRIYSFLVRESATDDPNLVVRITAEEPGTDPDNPPDAPNGAHNPAFVSRERVRGYEVMAEQAQLQIAEVRAEALADLDAFRADYPGRIRHAYRLPRQAREWPWRIEAMWHDGQFTYVRSSAQETPALYETQDGEPSLVAYDLHNDGLYVIRRIIGEGWFQLGDDRLTWRFTPPETD